MGDSVCIPGEGEVQEFAGVEAELFRWFRAEGVSEQGSRRAVALLDSAYLHAQLRPSPWNRRGNFGHQERCRYLWYRHAARILGWCDMQQFPEFVRALLRDQYYPSSSVIRSDEEIGARCHVEQIGCDTERENSVEHSSSRSGIRDFAGSTGPARGDWASQRSGAEEGKG
ncbi:hypothetical protein M758_12G018700 [Ceratodon purpureus]|nr:hypothetical protein M758_12G018700 [Ceratodon purpureus]